MKKAETKASMQITPDSQFLMFANNYFLTNVQTLHCVFCIVTVLNTQNLACDFLDILFEKLDRLLTGKLFSLNSE